MRSAWRSAMSRCFVESPDARSWCGSKRRPGARTAIGASFSARKLRNIDIRSPSFPRKRESSVFFTNATGSPLSRGRRNMFAYFQVVVLEAVALISILESDQIHVDVLSYSQRLEQLSHLGGREQFLHRSRFSQVSRRLRLAAARESIEDGAVDQEARLRRIARERH